MQFRDDETIGHEPQLPGANPDASPRRNDVATGVSGSPYDGDQQHESVYTGAGGDSVPGVERGFLTPKGTGITINESDGSETVGINHHSGASVFVDNDGTVVITSASQKGVAIESQGDIAMSGTAVAIDAKGALSIKTNGSLTLDVGGDLNLKVRGSIIEHAGNKHELINGSATREIVKDENTIVGGIRRTTVAGDERHQVTGTYSQDVGSDKTSRVGGDLVESVAGDSNYVAEGDMNITGEGDTTLFAGGTEYLTATEIKASPWVDRAEWSSMSDEALIAALGVPVVTEPPAVAGEAADSQDVQVMDANTIVDEMTSIRQIPEYERNAIYETEEMGSLGIVSHDAAPEAVEAYDMYSSRNRGTMYPATPRNWGGLMDTESGYSEYEVNSDILSEDLQSDPPTSTYNPNEQVAGAYLSELVNAPYSWSIPEDIKETILRAHAVLIQNALVPLRRAGFNFMVTSAYRNNSPNHRTGYAMDLQVPGRIFAKHVEIAQWAARNIPAHQVFLERSGSGYTHVHIRVHPPGQSGSPTLLTCGDPRCADRVAGIQPGYIERRVLG